MRSTKNQTSSPIIMGYIWYCTNRIPILSAFEMVQAPSLSMKPNLKVVESPSHLLPVTCYPSNSSNYLLIKHALLKTNPLMKFEFSGIRSSIVSSDVCWVSAVFPAVFHCRRLRIVPRLLVVFVLLLLNHFGRFQPP